MAWESYEPFHTRTAAGGYGGIDIEIASKVLKRMKCRFRIVPAPWSRQLKDLTDGGLYMMTGASLTEERKTFALFSSSYISVRNVVVVKKGLAGSLKVTKLDELSAVPNFKLGVAKAYEYGDVFTKAMAKANFKSIAEAAFDEGQNVKKLMGDRVAGILVNEVTFMALAKKENLLSQVEILPLDIGTDDLYFMFSKKISNKEFVTAFNGSLAALRRDGSLQKTIDQYLK